jgi:hypothetical protein
MLTIPKSVKLQSAADDAYLIGETVEALGTLMDRFYEKHGEEIGSRLTSLIPWHSEVSGPAAKKIYNFAHALEPPEN